MAARYIYMFRSLLDVTTAFFMNNSKIALQILLISSSIVWILTAVAIRRRRLASQRPAPGLEKPICRQGGTFKSPERQPGVWIPMDFKRPVAAPYPNWDVLKTEPLAYRPFKYGPDYITMGLRTMKWDEWIELDNQYLEWHSIKAKRIAERGDQCCKTAPEAYDGAVELLEEL